MKKPVFSIILPVYNVSDYLSRCVESIRSQSFTDYEMILVDDGSTDASGSMCDEYASRIKNCRVIHKENGGLSSARNAGLKVAAGKYVFMVDSDDWIETDALEKIYLRLDNEPDIVKFNYIRQPENAKVSSSLSEGAYDEKEIKTRIIKEALERTGKFCFSAWSHVYRLDFLKENHLKFVSERRIGSEDYLFNFHAYVRAGSLAVLGDALYHYDLREGSLTQKYRKNLPKQYDELHQEIRKIIVDSNMEHEMLCSLSYSYMEKMIGVCIQNECRVTKDHSILEGWRNTHKMVVSKTFKELIPFYPMEEVRTGRKIIVTLMKHRIVLPVMFLLVRKNKRRS